MSVRVLGVAALVKKMDRMDREAGNAAARSAREGAKVVADEARSLAPYRTGELRRSIEDGPGETKDSARAGTNLWRAHFAEFGTVKAAAHPFLFPAFEAKRKQVVNSIIAAKVRGAIRGALR